MHVISILMLIWLVARIAQRSARAAVRDEMLRRVPTPREYDPYDPDWDPDDGGEPMPIEYDEAA